MKVWILAALASTGLAGGMGHAASADADHAEIWYDRHAKSAEIAAAYPKAARDQKISGDVRLDCAADVQGNVRDCKVAEEIPTGMGFGAAALGLAARERFGN